MDLSSDQIALTLLEEIIEWRKQFIPESEVEFRWNDLHLSIVRDYFSEFFIICDFREQLPSANFFNELRQNAVPGSSTVSAETAASFTLELKELFVVPRLKEFHESQNSIKKHLLVEAFLSFLLQLLYHKTDAIVCLCGGGIDNLEKELRFLLTILGDASLMLWDEEHEEFQKLLVEFEAVANEAGGLVHSLFFSIDVAFQKDERIGVLLNHIDLLKANIMKFVLNLSPSNRRSAYTTPTTSVVDSLQIVNSLIHDLKDLMKQEGNRIADVKDQIKILHQGLMLFQSSIKDIGHQQSSQIRELKEPLMRIGGVAHEAEYLIISFLAGHAPMQYFINRLININDKIELIGTELQEIRKKHKVGDFEVAKYFRKQLSLQAKRNTEVDDVIVGFDDNAVDVLDQLVGGTNGLQVTAIIGMAGLGKTTFAKNLYNHGLVSDHFDKLLWCVVSQTYQRKSILADVLIKLTSDLDKDSILKVDEETLVGLIYKTLKGRRYLIVLDDIWDSNVWDGLQRCFPDDKNGSRILLTSRNKDVAPLNSTIWDLPSLSNDQCWELLEKKVFGHGPCPPELQEIGKEIAENCCGLPLAVVVIAGVLLTRDGERSKWEEVEGNLASYIFSGADDSLSHILELSYLHLPDHLKPCFLYFGAFKQDEEILVKKLVMLWIAEGFVHAEEEKSAENIAEDYLMELIDKSLVMVSRRGSDGGIKACVIHDLLLELCLKRCEEENFLKLVRSGVYAIYEKDHLVCIEGCISWRYCQHVRSLRGDEQASPFYVGDMRLLRVLHLAGTHYIGIEFLVNLRYLVISDLPPSLDNLANLEYLRVETNETVYLSSTIIGMKKLRHIHVGSEAIYDEDCDSSQTNNLECISHVTVRKPKDEDMLKCSPHLRKLKCQFDELSTHQNFDLSCHDQLESLTVRLYEDRLNEISFPSNIKKLTLSSSMLLDEMMSVIGRLENLEILKLIGIGFVGERWDTRDGDFQKLRVLKLYKIEDLNEWNVDSSEHFPQLQQLVLRSCCNLQEIPFEIGFIPTLQLIQVHGLHRESLVESANIIQREQWDMGNEVLRVDINQSDKILTLLFFLCLAAFF